MVEEIERVEEIMKRLNDDDMPPGAFIRGLNEMADALGDLGDRIKEHQSLKKVRWPDNPEKIYGHLMYHEWFYEWNDIKEAFDDIIKLYMTEKWWDYERFDIFKGNPGWEAGVDKPIDWKEMLTEEQRAELKRAEEYNDNCLI